MNELQELVVRAIEATHAATEPRGWWDASLGYLNSAVFWAAFAAFSSLGAAVMSYCTARKTQKNAALAFYHQCEAARRRDYTEWYKSLLSASSNGNPEPLRLGQLSRLQYAELQRLVFENLSNISVGADVPISTSPPETWSVAECFICGELSRLPKFRHSPFHWRVKDQMKCAGALFDEWARSEKNEGRSGSWLEAPLFSDTPTPPPPK